MTGKGTGMTEGRDTWIPAFAGMTEGASWVPACAGISHVGLSAHTTTDENKGGAAPSLTLPRRRWRGLSKQ